MDWIDSWKVLDRIGYCQRWDGNCLQSKANVPRSKKRCVENDPDRIGQRIDDRALSQGEADARVDGPSRYRKSLRSRFYGERQSLFCHGVLRWVANR